MAQMNPELAAAILDVAKRNSWDPVNLGTVISYETGGTFDPWKAGPTTQWGQHRGLIQWGEPQARKYGVTKDTSVTDQMLAVEKYLKDRGLKPGASLLDTYSTVNAGAPGLYDRSDANNGGAPGTVRDKVERQMGAHRLNAATLLGVDPGMLPSPAAQPLVAGAAAAPAAAGPVTAPAAAVPSDNGFGALMAQLQQIPKILGHQQGAEPPPPPQIPDNMAMRLALIAAAKQGIQA